MPAAVTRGVCLISEAHFGQRRAFFRFFSVSFFLAYLRTLKLIVRYIIDSRFFPLCKFDFSVYLVPCFTSCMTGS